MYGQGQKCHTQTKIKIVNEYSTITYNLFCTICAEKQFFVIYKQIQMKWICVNTNLHSVLYICHK